MMLQELYKDVVWVTEGDDSAQTEAEYEVFGSYTSRQDDKTWRRTFKASSPAEAKEKALKYLHRLAAHKANRISMKSIKVGTVRKVS